MTYKILMSSVAALSFAACAQMTTPVEPSAQSEAYLESSEQLEQEAAQLNHLARIAIDAHELYHEAAEEADNEELRAELTQLATTRHTFAQDLQARVATLGEDPAERGEAVGSFHRTFAQLRGLVQDDSLTAAAEVYRGESYMIDEWNEALEKTMTAESRAIVVAQLDTVEADRERIEALKNSIEARLEAKDEADALQRTSADAGQ